MGLLIVKADMVRSKLIIFQIFYYIILIYFKASQSECSNLNKYLKPVEKCLKQVNNYQNLNIPNLAFPIILVHLKKITCQQAAKN